MRIGVVGGSGFIGRHLLPELSAKGYGLRASFRKRRPRDEGDIDWRGIDMNEAVHPTHWESFVEGLDLIILAAGILRSTAENDLDSVHAFAPAALYSAAVEAGIERVIHISALGASADARSHYHRSKFAGEQALRESGLEGVILRPSLIFGIDGDSTRQFVQLARLPRIPVYRCGSQRVQPVHIDDVVRLIVELADQGESGESIIPVVGESPVSMREYYSALRAGLGYGKARFFNAPELLVQLLARFGDHLGSSPLCSDTLTMLGEHNVSSPKVLKSFLNRGLRPWQEFPKELGHEL